MPKSIQTKFTRFATNVYRRTAQGGLRKVGNHQLIVASRYTDGNISEQIQLRKQYGAYVKQAKRLVKTATTFKQALSASVFMTLQQCSKVSTLKSLHTLGGGRAAIYNGLTALPYQALDLAYTQSLPGLAANVFNMMQYIAFPRLDQKENDLLSKWLRAYENLRNQTWAAIENNELSRIPVSQQTLFDYMIQVPHVSLNKPEMIAYYQNTDKIERGIETRIAAGRYFRKLLGNDSDDLVRELATAHTQRYAGLELKFVENTDSPDDWYKVYENGPSSCIGDRPWAARPYAYPGNTLRLAYLGDIDGHVSARTIVVDNGQDKGYIRIYGDVDRLRFALRAAGYTAQVDLYEFGPVKLRKMYRDDQLICPYIDGNDPWVTEQDGYLEVDESGDESAQDSDNIGYLGSGGCRCARCGDHVDSDETYYVEDMGDVCTGCYDNHYTTPEIGNPYERAYAVDECSKVFKANGLEAFAPTAFLRRADDYVRLDQEWDDIEYCHIEFAVYIDGSGGGYFHPDDDDITYVKSEQAWALMEDTVETYEDKRELKENCVLMHDGFWAHQDDSDLVYTRHGWALDGDCTELDEAYDLENDPETVTHALDTDQEELARNELTEQPAEEPAPV